MNELSLLALDEMHKEVVTEEWHIGRPGPGTGTAGSCRKRYAWPVGPQNLSKATFVLH